MDDIAGRAFGWVASVAVEVEGGLGWLELGERHDDLYAGTAGVLLGCAEAVAAGLDPGRIAAGARDRLCHTAERGTDLLPDDGLFTGWAGVALALGTWARLTGDAGAADAAGRVSASVAARVAAQPSAVTDIISGEAGILLALLADESGAGLDAAAIVADRLVERAEPGPGGAQWRMDSGQEYLMPGFSHGTAGVAYALAVAGRTLRRPDLVDVAVRGADALIAVGDHPDGWAVPLLIPVRPDRPPVAYGWCHGPTGTVRLFALLHELDPRPRWRHALDACLKALRDSQIPARLYPGYWDNVARCCGTAGVGQLLLDRYRATGDPDLLAWADTLAGDVLARTVTTPDGPTWSNTEHTATPPDLPPEAGFMQGTAGIAGWLARLAAAHREPTAPPAVIPWL